MTTWKPRDSDIEWARVMLRLTADGATIVYPSSLLAYRVDHKAKTLTRLDIMGVRGEEELHRRTVVLFKVVGYRVLDPTKN